MKKYLHICPVLLVFSLFSFTCFSTVLAASATPSSPSSQQPGTGGVQENFSATDLITPAAQQYAEIEAVKKEMVDTFSSHVTLMAYGFTVLGVFTGILALVGLFVTFFSVRAYIVEIRKKKANFEKYEQELKSLLETGKKHCQSLNDMLSQQGAKVKFSGDVLKEAKGKILAGSGSEVLLGKAILAQEDEQWEKARIFWTSILEDEPDNDSALFSAALSCFNLFQQQGCAPAHLSLLHEAVQYFKRIPSDRINDAVLSNWGYALNELATFEQDADKKSHLLHDAAEKCERASKLNPQNDSAWNNWGYALNGLAELEQDADKRKELQRSVMEKHAHATELNPENDAAWNNWGSALIDLAELEQDADKKCQLLHDAMEKYGRATELNPQNEFAWNNWGHALNELAKLELDVEKKRQLLRSAVEKLERMEAADNLTDRGRRALENSRNELAKLK